MADKKECINWFLEEIPILTEKGIIQAETATALTEHYRSDLAAQPPKREILAVGVIGVVMAVIGAVLFLTCNWDIFPKFVRIGVAALPLLLGAAIAYFSLSRDVRHAWREGAALITSTGIATLMAVIAQVYHIENSISEFCLMLALFALPLIYIFNSIVLATICVVLSFFVISAADIAPWWNAVLIALVMPYLLFHFYKKTLFRVWGRHLAMIAAVSLFLGCGLACYGAFTLVLMSSIFVAAGMDLQNSNSSDRNPWLLPAFTVQLVLLLIGCFVEKLFQCDWAENDDVLWTYGITNGLLFIGYLVMFFRKRITIDRVASLSLILLTAIPMIYKNGARWVSGSAMQQIFTLYTIAYGIVFICYGIRKKQRLLFNCGVIAAGAIAACYLFSFNIGLFFQALCLIVLGIGFLLSNWLFVKLNKEAGK